MTRPRRLFSYVVHHDFGLSPNPKGGYCTLAFCKFREPGQRRRNVVEMAEEGDWVVGASGKGEQSFGAHGHLIYAMEVTQKLTLRDYFLDPRFAGRAGNRPEYSSHTDMFALVSDHFFAILGATPARSPAGTSTADSNAAGVGTRPTSRRRSSAISSGA